FLVVVAANRARRAVGARDETAIELDAFEGLDILQLSGFGDFEVGLLQIADRIAVLVADDDVDPDEIDASPEDGSTRRRRRLLTGLLLTSSVLLSCGGRRLRRRLLLRIARSA